MLRNGQEDSRKSALDAVLGGMSQRKAAKIFNVCSKTIRKMINGEGGKDPKDKSKPPVLSSQELAESRANVLSTEMNTLFSGSMYPVINPEAMRIAPAFTYRTSRLDGSKVQSESTPRTWLSATLRVQPVKDPKCRTYIFTGAQNDTPINVPFWENLNALAARLDAEIVVGPWTYETNWWSENNPASRHYDPKIKEHLCFGRMEIGDKFMFGGEMNTLPTSSKPINDLTTYSEGRWAVYPHSRVQLLSVPSINPSEQSFHIMSTGAVTEPQVIPRKAGIKSIAHHVFGATIVEFDHEGDVFCRQITADTDGSFQDLDIQVRNGKTLSGKAIEALTAADIHIAKQSSKNALATFGFDYKTGNRATGSIVECLNPEYVILHDIHDHESRNHHHKDDVSHFVEMAHRGRDSVKGEISRSVRFLEMLSETVDEIKVVESNHDIALDRYIREGRYIGDGENHIYGLELDNAYHQCRLRQADQIDDETEVEKFSLLEWAIRGISEYDLSKVSWVYDNDTFILSDVQLGFHGFRGTNGAKGTVTGYARMGRKITIGDKHSPQILDKVYGAGVMQLQHGYNKGPSGWSVSHVVQYPNGHRSMLTMNGGKWRAVRNSVGKIMSPLT